MRSPVGGDVLRVLQESTRVVAAGTPLLEVGKPAELELVIDVLSMDAVKVKPGATILVDRWGGDRILQAKVRQVEPSAFTKVSALGVEEQRGLVEGEGVVLYPTEQLKDGGRLEVR